MSEPAHRFRRMTYEELEAARREREALPPAPRSKPGDIYRIPYAARTASMRGSAHSKRRKDDPRHRHGGVRGQGVRTHEDDFLGADFLRRALGGGCDGE